MKTKWISALLMFCMLLSTIPFSTSATTETADAYVPMQNYSAEIAAVTTDWSINDAEDWRKAVEISEGEAGLTFEGQTLHLTADIDMANQAVDPLCYGINFNGTLDGHGYVFKNFKMEITSAAGCFVGLIGTVGENGVVKNLGIENGEITLIYSGTVTSVGIGAIAGRMATGGQILRCWNGADVTADVTGSEDDVSVGGIVGRGLRGSVVDGCYNIGAVSGALHAAGINDWMQTYDAKNSSGLIKNCFNAGSLSADYVGVGRLPKTSSSNSFMNTYSIGSNVAFSALTEVGQDTAAVLNAVNTAETSNLKKVEYTSGKLAWKLNSNFIGDGEQTFYTVQNQKTIFGDVTNQTVKLNFVHDGETVAEAYMNADSAICLDELQDSYLEAEYNVGEEATLENGNVLSLQAVPANKTLTVEIISGTHNEFVEENFWQYTVEEDGITLVQYLGTATDVYIPSVLEHEGTKYPVVKLGVGLFQDNINLKSVTFGDGILELGDKAFSGCTGLTSITIPDSVTIIEDYAFYGCTGLISITIPDSVTIIEDFAFRNCTGLTSITIPDSVTIIKDYAFMGCTGLTSITIPDIATSIGFKAFYNCGYYNNDDNWENGALYIGKHLIEVKTTISGAYTIKDGSLTIGAYAFSNCDGLTSVTIPDSVISIMRYAFRGCTGLTSIIIPDSVTSIGSSAFSGCTGLTSVYITDIAAWCNITFVGYSANPLYYAKKLYLNNELVTDLVIPDSVTSIGNYAFYGCTGLTSITIPDSVVSIGGYAFYKCTGLTSLTIPDSVTSIGNYAFYGCTGLTSVTIPYTVTSIGTGVFSDSPVTLKVHEDSAGHLYAVDNSTSYELTKHTYFRHRCTVCKQLEPGYEILSGTTGDCTWTMVGTFLTISGNGAMADYTLDSASPWGTSITAVVLEAGVTSIGACAFRNCDNLTSVVIPEGVIKVGDRTFHMCDGLISVSIPASVKQIGIAAFSAENLENVYITDLAAWCNIDFDYNKRITSTGGYSRTLGANPLYYAENLYLNDELVTELTIPNGVTMIKPYLFENYQNLTSVKMADSVTTLGEFAFSSCDNLTSVHIGRAVVAIEFGCFNLCEQLNSVYITDLKAWCNIEFGNFNATPLYYAGSLYLNNSLITNLEIPQGITIIKNFAFSGGECFTSVNIPESVTAIGDYAFQICKGISSIVIPDSVVSIGDYSFVACSGLTSVDLSDRLVSIGDGAFRNCTSLTSIDIPEGVTSIGYYAFRNCQSLTSIMIPDGVTSIGDYAFYGCTGLTSVIIPYSVTSIGVNAFYNGSSDVQVALEVHEDTAGHAYALEYGNTISKLIEHTPASADAIIPASCTKEGARTNRCSVCGLEYTKPIPMTAHTPDFDLEGNLLCSVCGTSQVGDGRYTIDKVSYLIKDGKLVDGEIADWGEEKDFFIVGGRPAPAGVYNYDGKTLYVTAGYKLANGVTVVSDSVFAEGLCVEVGKAYLFEEGCLVDGKTAAWSDGEEYLIVKGRPAMGGTAEIDGKIVYLLSDGSYADGVWQMTNEDICAKLGITVGLNYLFEEGCLVDGKAAAWSDGEEYFIVKGRPAMGGTAEIDGKIVYLLSDGSYANGVWHVTDEDICTKLGITAGLNYLFEEGVLVRGREAVWTNDNSYFIVDGRPFNRGVIIIDGQPTYILNYKKVNGVWSLKGEEGKAVAEAFGIQPEKAYLFEEGKLVDGKNAAWANGQTYYIVKGRPF